MNDNPYINWSSKSDLAIEKDLGLFIKETRLLQNKTQSNLAKAADISRSTLSLLERGETGTVATLIKVLRVLDQLEVFQHFVIYQQISPLALAKQEQDKRQRANGNVEEEAAPYKVEW